MVRLTILLVCAVMFTIGCASAPPISHHNQDNEAFELFTEYEPRPLITLTAANQQAEQKDTIDDELLDDEVDLDEDETEVVDIADPFYYWNKGWFYFNDFFYFYLLKPVGIGYRFVFPEVVRNSVRNFFVNITFPIRFVNNLLQAKGKGAEMEFSRFAINSFFGIGGLFDVAKKYNGMDPPPVEDFGQTLGEYGVGPGFYLVWPVLGPSTLRDSIGLAGDSFLNPVNYVTPFFFDSLAIRAVETVNKTSLAIGEYEAFKEGALDPYIALRSAYIQSRKKKIGYKYKPLVFE